MNTLIEDELAEVAASGYPVANWPPVSYVPPPPVWPAPDAGGGRNDLPRRMTDS